MIKKPFFDEKSDFFIENQRFFKLIRFYAFRLNYKEAETDLTEFLFELWTAGRVINDKYVAVCLRNEYIRLSKKRQSEFSAYPFFDDLLFCDFDIDLQIDIACALKCLSKIQRDILQLFFVAGFSVDEISKRFCISRQAVNQNKKRALVKLSSKFKD